MKRSFIRSVLVWMSRIRYRRGYGVHSPFAYSFFRDIIFETLPFYAFDYLDKNCDSSPYKRKTLHVFYRIVNLVSPALLLDIKSPSSSPACYMAGVFKKTRPMILLDDEEKGKSFKSALTRLSLNAEFYQGNIIKNILEISEKSGKFDFVHIGQIESKGQLSEILEVLANCMSEKGVIVVDAINKSDVAEIWHRLADNQNATVAFDLYDIGILFFDKKLNKEYYKVNYW